MTTSLCTHASVSFLWIGDRTEGEKFRRGNEIYVMENEENENRKEFDTLQVEFAKSCNMCNG